MSNSFFCDFFYIFFRSFSIVHHLSIIVSIIAKSLFHIIFFHWRSRCDDREMIVDEKKSCWKKKHRLNCVMSCMCFWIEKRMKIAKILRIVIEFRFKKKEFDIIFNDSKFDLFILINVICFINFFQNEMMLFSSKKMKKDFEIMKYEFSNWFIDDVEIDEANWLEMSVAHFDDDDLSNWRINRIKTIQKIVSLNQLKNRVEIEEKIKKRIAMN